MTIDERALPIRIPRGFCPGMGVDDLYEATRKWWVVSPHRHSPDYAFAIVNGTVRGVFTINTWEQNPERQRWAFHGEQDKVMEDKYLGANMSEHFSRGAQNPIRYVNC